MSLETIITQFGYPGLTIGLLFEGETVLVIGAFMAHRGYMDLPLVILTATLVSFGMDQFFFWLGRTKGSEFLEKHPAWTSGAEKAKTLLHRNTTLLFLGVRFMYGLRTILPFVIGMSKANPKKFVLLDLLGAALWATLFGVAGYLFGHTVELIFGDIHEYEHWIVLGIILIAVSVWFYRKRTNSKE